MTETRTPYDAGQQPESADLSAIEARLAAVTEPPWGRGWLEKRCIATRGGDGLVILRNGGRSIIADADFYFIIHAPADLRALVDEVWRLRLALETEQRAKWAAEQDKQHWQEKAEQLQEELDVTDFLLDTRNQVMNAIPECPDHGSQCVPHALAWIEKQVAGLAKVKQLRALLGRNRQEAEDDAIRLQDANHQAQMEIEQLQLQVAQLTEALEAATGIIPSELPEIELLTDNKLDMVAIAARLAAATVSPWNQSDEAWGNLIAHAPADLRALVDEVRRLRQDDAVWEKHGLTQTVTERNKLRAELDAIRHAAHMPDDYEHGLPSWINQHLYGKLMEWTDSDGGPIRRSEDVEEVEQLRLQVAQLAEALEGEWRRDDCE